MMMQWTTRGGVKKAVDVDAIMRLEFTSGVRPMLNIMTCDIMDTICGRPSEPVDGYNPENDTSEVVTSGQKGETHWSIPDQMEELHDYLVKEKSE